MLTSKDGNAVPTNAFALLTGHYLLPTMTQCAVFKGTTKSTFLDKREYDGPIQEQQEQAYQFVLRNIRLGARIKGLYRQDVYEIPPAAIRELLVNSVLHRSYLNTSNIQVALYDDRLEVLSPGKLPIDQTIEAMRTGFSKIRNEAIAKVFAYMGLIEGWGSCIPKINALLTQAGLNEMEISGGDFYLKFTIYRNPDFDPRDESHEQHVGDVGLERQDVGLERQDVGLERQDVVWKRQDVGLETCNVGIGQCKEKVVLHVLSENPQATARDLAIRLHTTTRTAERILRGLKQSGKIRRESGKRYGHWVILE